MQVVWWLVVGSLVSGVCGVFNAERCRTLAYTINVVLLEDESSPWSLKFVKPAVQRSITQQNHINYDSGLNFTIKALYRGFNTTFYRRRGCGSSTCEGVEILKSLHNSSDVGCAMLGPSCTYAAFQLVDQEVGLTLTIPILSAGSFGLSCDFKEKLTRLLPTARKVSNFFLYFWNVTTPRIKTVWKTAYVYKQPNISEECFWYINALEASTADFSQKIERIVLRSQKEMSDALNKPNRNSNIFILCGSPNDIISIKSEVTVSKDITFILIDLFSDVYLTNTSSLDYMKDVLVLTINNIRNYTAYSFFAHNSTTMNDYVAGYYDAVGLFGHVMRQQLLSAQNQGRGNMLNTTGDNPFRNIIYYGAGGRYVLDSNGDRDVNFSLIYTTTTNQYKTLYEFDTSKNVTQLKQIKPDLTWPGSSLPKDVPDYGDDASVK